MICAGASTIAEKRDSGGAVIQRRYFARGEHIAGTNYFYLRDHRYSIRELTDNSATVQARYDYDAYGRRTVGASLVDADFGFTGHLLHQPSGMYLAMYRVYNPEIGTWITRDPIVEGIGLNLYLYTLNNPINYLDPDGRMPVFAPLLAFPPVGVIALVGLGIVGAVLLSQYLLHNPPNICPADFAKQYEPTKKGRPKPKNCPAGTVPLPASPWKDVVHDIKDGIGAAPNDWVGVTPAGEVVTADAEGNPEYHGPADNFAPKGRKGD